MTTEKDTETAEGLIAYVRERQSDEDGGGEWMAFALMDYERKVRDDERERLNAEVGALANAVAARVVERLAGAGAAHQRRNVTSQDRNLVTVSEFAAALDVAESTVFEWLKLGLPSVKAKGLGRRVHRREAEAFIVSNGLSRSRSAKKLTARLTSAATSNGRKNDAT